MHYAFDISSKKSKPNIFLASTKIVMTVVGESNSIYMEMEMVES